MTGCACSVFSGRQIRVAPVDSPAEREADRIADAVIRGGSVSAPPAAPGGPPAIHRKCAACAAGGPPCAHCAEEELMRKAVGPAMPSAANAAAAAAAISGGGQPLSPATRSYFEPRFGADLSGVRVHTEARAARAARGIGAKAYAMGPHVAFAPGRYAPSTGEGRRLLAHELAHVVQGHGTAGPGPSVFREGEDDAATAEPAAPLSRQEEIALSRSSPGRVTATLRPFRFVLENFAIDSARLKDEHRAVLAELRRLIAVAEPGALRVVIVGHADESGPELHNSSLSVRRARAVRSVLGRASVAGIAGFGEASPLDPADSVEARSRNRRVEILLLPGPRPPPPVRVEEETPVDDDTPTPVEIRDPLPVDESFCERFPLICAALLAGGGIAIGEFLRRLLWNALRSAAASLAAGGLAAALSTLATALSGLGGALAAAVGSALAYCLANPSACLPDTDGPGGDDDTDDDRDNDEEDDDPPERHACVDVVNLPSGALPPAVLQGVGVRYFLQRSFNMSIMFRDDPETGCDCSCGEYLQKVNGTFEKNLGAGWVRMRAPPTVSSSQLHPTRPEEDARHGRLPYGHRFSDAARSSARDPEDFDQFLPAMEDGCLYSGSDSPGITFVTDPPPAPGTEYRFHLEFSGVPVDGCHGRRPIPGHRHEWTVDGYARIPEPTEEPPGDDAPEPTPDTDDTDDARATDTAPPPRYDGPTIGPAPDNVVPVPTDPNAFCVNDNIACITAEYLLDRRLVVTEAEIERAVLLEFQALRNRCRVHRWRPTPVQPDRPLIWDGYVRSQARARVRRYLAARGMLFDSDPGPLCQFP